MSAVAPSELSRLWAQEQLPVERAIGQMLQQLVAMQATLDRQVQTISDLRAQIADISTRSQQHNLTSNVQKQPKTKG